LQSVAQTNRIKVAKKLLAGTEQAFIDRLRHRHDLRLYFGVHHA
jgi:hypothetical protein